MRALAVAAILFGSVVAYAQREFVEEVEPDKKQNLDSVDLDAPDPAATGKKPKDAKAKPGDPKAKPADLKAVESAKPADPKAVESAKPADPKAVESAKPADPAAKPADPAAKPADPAATPAPPADALPEGGVQVLETTYEAFLEKWDARASMLRRGETARAKKQLADLDAAFLDFGVQGVPGGFQATAPATALLRESKRAIDEGNLDEAQALVDSAEHSAPDLAAVHSANALLKWKNGDVGGTVNALLEWAKATCADPLSASQLAARATALVFAVVVLALVLFALLAGLPALRYLSFDLLRLLPKGAHGGQVLALVVMLAILPLVVGAGPILGALWILVLAFLYLERRERVVVAVLAVVSVATPFALEYGARFVAYPDSRADRATRALFDASAEPLRRALLKKSPAELDTIEQAALALAAKREGRIPDAVQRWTTIVNRNPDLGWAHGDLGVAASLGGSEDQALAELGKAVSANPHQYAASFDISVIHYRAGRTDKAQSAVSPVAKEAPSLLNAFRRTTFRQPDQLVGQNRALVDVYPDKLSLFAATMQPSAESAGVVENVARLLLRGFTGQTAAGMLAAAPLLFLLLGVARKKIAPAQPCVRCGDPASKRTNDKDVPEDTCSQCFHAFVSTRSRIDAGVKLRKEREIIRRRTRKSRAILGLAVVCPGAGHVFAGAPARGLALFALFALGLGCQAMARGMLPMARLSGPWSDLPAIVATGAVCVVVWLAGLRSAWLLAEEATGRGRR
jgi:tetratricopeptide (TPR) repeat protein